jgi:hypothetical protein
VPKHRAGNADVGTPGAGCGPSEGEDIVFYPDSGKIGVYANDVYELYRRNRAVGYWDGEKPPSQ